jgi:hypothetical protein
MVNRDTRELHDHMVDVMAAASRDILGTWGWARHDHTPWVVVGLVVVVHCG